MFLDFDPWILFGRREVGRFARMIKRKAAPYLDLPRHLPFSSGMPGVIVKPRARIFHGHDWIYASDIQKTFGDPNPVYHKT